MHHSLELAIGALLLAAAGAFALKQIEHFFEKYQPYRARVLMSPAEREAYARLLRASPENLIFGQVQFCRAIEPKAGAHRRWRLRIAQLSADFVICRPDTSVLAVVEIDDRTHDRAIQRKRDRKKDAACRAAGIPIIRWQARQLPSSEEMRRQLTSEAAIAGGRTAHRS
jgi:very-short-patch-repair endonuclease